MLPLCCSSHGVERTLDPAPDPCYMNREKILGRVRGESCKRGGSRVGVQGVRRKGGGGRVLGI